MSDAGALHAAAKAEEGSSDALEVINLLNVMHQTILIVLQFFPWKVVGH